MELNTTSQLLKIDSIDKLAKKLLTLADGEIIVGDGESFVEKAPGVKITHEFTDGVYIRRMDLDKNSLIISAVHKQKHVWFLMKGCVTVADKNGVQDYKAPCYTISNPGTQRAIQANEDSIWINCHKNVNDTRDIEELEEQIAVMSVEEYNESIKNK